MEYIKTTEKIAVPNYPYGYHRTTAFFSVEHVKNKGFRSVFQTINPKTGLLNKPKKSTYAPAMVLKKDEDGKIRTHVLEFYGDEGQKKDIQFLAEHFDLFTPDEIKDTAGLILAITKANIQAKVIYTNSAQDKLLPLYEKMITALIKIYKTGENHFSLATIDIPAVESLEQKDYNPFKITTHEIR